MEVWVMPGRCYFLCSDGRTRSGNTLPTAHLCLPHASSTASSITHSTPNTIHKHCLLPYPYLLTTSQTAVTLFQTSRIARICSIAPPRLFTGIINTTLCKGRVWNSCKSAEAQPFLKKTLLDAEVLNIKYCPVSTLLSLEKEVNGEAGSYLSNMHLDTNDIIAGSSPGAGLPSVLRPC